MFDFMDMGFDQTEPINLSGLYIPEASECMRCGMCVSACPTFRLFQVDEETPRGRLRSISKLLVENQPISPEEQLHLNKCLQCRACEPMCPSRMAYGQLFDQAQTQLKGPPKGWAKLALWLISAKNWRLRLMPLLAFYLKFGLQRPLRSSGFLQKLGLAEAEALLEKPALQSLKAFYPAMLAKRGTVALFTGCIAEHFDRETLLAAIRILNAMGYDVQVPKAQGCCGAIHQHNGQAAEILIANNIEVFNALGVDAVIYTASGCGAMLSEYSGAAGAEVFRHRLCDIHEFVLQHWPEDWQLKPLNLNVAVHEPCSQRNVLKNTQTVYALLQKIPGLKIVPLPDNQVCCGAGGSYLLTHPENAERLRAMKRQAIVESEADVVVSANYGCAVFLKQPTLPIVHPILLLAQQLRAHN